MFEIVPAAAGNVAVELPAATTTVCRVVRLAVLVERPTVAPPVGAAWFSVTAQFEVPLAPRSVGEHATDETTGKPLTPPRPPDSTPPMDGGLVLVLPQTSVSGAPTLLPAPIAGLPAAGVKLKLDGEL